MNECTNCAGTCDVSWHDELWSDLLELITEIDEDYSTLEDIVLYGEPRDVELVKTDDTIPFKQLGMVDVDGELHDIWFFANGNWLIPHSWFAEVRGRAYLTRAVYNRVFEPVEGGV